VTTRPAHRPAPRQPDHRDRQRQAWYAGGHCGDGALPRVAGRQAHHRAGDRRQRRHQDDAL